MEVSANLTQFEGHYTPGEWLSRGQPVPPYIERRVTGWRTVTMRWFSEPGEVT